MSSARSFLKLLKIFKFFTKTTNWFNLCNCLLHFSNFQSLPAADILLLLYHHHHHHQDDQESMMMSFLQLLEISLSSYANFKIFTKLQINLTYAIVYCTFPIFSVLLIYDINIIIIKYFLYHLPSFESWHSRNNSI